MLSPSTIHSPINNPISTRGWRLILLIGALLTAIFPVSAQDTAPPAASQGPTQPGAVFRVEVDMVLLNVAVTDSKGNYVVGLKPWDFQISEDGVEEKLATFGEGNEAPRPIGDLATLKSSTQQPVQLSKPTRGPVTNRDNKGTPSSVFAQAST